MFKIWQVLFLIWIQPVLAQNWPSSNEWWSQENERPSMFDHTKSANAADEVIQQKNVDQELQQNDVERELQQGNVEKELQQNEIEQKIQQNNVNNLNQGERQDFPAYDRLP